MSQEILPPEYLLFVNLSPLDVSDATWVRWFVTCHLPSLLQSRTCTRIALYREVFPHNTPAHPLRLLALYHTHFERLQDCKEFKQVRPEGDVEADMRNYKVVQDQDFHPNCIDQSRAKPTPTLLTTEMNPLTRTHPHFEEWYRTSHLAHISRLPCYKRSKLYQLSGGCENSSATFLGSEFLAVHELQVRGLDMNVALQEERQHVKNATRWTRRQIRESEMVGRVGRRGWRLVWAQGR